MRVVGAAVIADVSGSTPLYESQGAQRAVQEIRWKIDQLRTLAGQSGGDFIHSKGDDILVHFPEAGNAVAAVKTMVAGRADDLLRVHAGVSWGEMLRVPDDLSGSPVNRAARRAALAKPREALVYGTCFDQLDAAARADLRRVDVLQLKGAADMRSVHSYVAGDPSARTETFFSRLGSQAPAAGVTLSHGETAIDLLEGSELTLGRSAESAMVIAAPWVSRRHATVSVANGLVELRDHSTFGTYLTLAPGTETILRRSAVTLSGQGLFSLGAPRQQSEAAVVAFTLARK